MFTDFYNGYERPMTVQAVTPHGLLVTQEHRRVKLSGTDENGVAQPYESEYEIFALIDSADFLNSVPNFRTIAPVRYGGASALS